MGAKVHYANYPSVRHFKRTLIFYNTSPVVRNERLSTFQNGTDIVNGNVICAIRTINLSQSSVWFFVGEQRICLKYAQITLLRPKQWRMHLQLVSRAVEMSHRPDWRLESYQLPPGSAPSWLWGLTTDLVTLTESDRRRAVPEGTDGRRATNPNWPRTWLGDGR